MEDYYYRRNYIPSFGNWDWNDHLPFTQCFDSSTTAAYAGAAHGYSEVRDLYVAGDLYHNDVVTPAMIVVPRSTTKRHRQVREGKKETDTETETATVQQKATTKPKPKPVDEDLYKISPHLLSAKPKKKRGLSYIASCFVPTCLV
ncbi:uncharacterized protein LOC111023056 [Momordica charantia]|uniref:Uncharacterized protein LOC111023056 n=1 Tax=Momordica charantia TaxID=3673 RepID=A0A6J1DPB1_MOMCH|nr:uncharacterized protein LOC111023056 [Momordica charantia]